MAKPNPLQAQLLKAGLVNKAKVAEVAREQNKARHGKSPADPSESQLAAERARIEKVERDRALEAERKALARSIELRAQARQIIADKKLPRTGDSDYRFTVDGTIRSLPVNDEQRRKLATGAIVVVRHGDTFELLPRLAGDKVRERDATLIVLDHGQGQATEPSTGNAEDDAYYAQFTVPDDLVW